MKLNYLSKHINNITTQARISKIKYTVQEKSG